MSASHTVRLIAPSGYCVNQQAAQLGADFLINTGYRLENADVVSRRFQRFAGTDEQRLADINELADGRELPDIALAVRGGYGASRLLTRINYAALGKRLAGQPFALCGHSDFTAIQLALLSQCGLVTFSSPMLAGNFGASPPSAFTLQHFRNLLSQESYIIRWSGNIQKDLSAQGILWGGNLAMLCTLAGTPWMPEIENGILVIEDINEHPYKVERMLLQLFHCGVLQRQQAVITGSFTGGPLSDYDQGFSLDTVWRYLQKISGVPFIDGLAFGHEQDTVTLPIGAHASLETTGQDRRLTVSGYPVLRE